MPDISMCDGLNSSGLCLMRNECYRHTATANQRQSYFMTAPFKKSEALPHTQECAEFLPNRDMNKL